MRFQTLWQLKEFSGEFSQAPIYDMGGNTQTYRTYQKYDLNKIFSQKLISVDRIKAKGVDIVDDLQTLKSFKNASIENIICSDVLEHVINPFKVVDNFYRILKPGGTVYLATLFIYPVHGTKINRVIQDFWRFTPECLRMLFAKFKIKKYGYQFWNGDTLTKPDFFKKGVFILAQK